MGSADSERNSGAALRRVADGLQIGALKLAPGRIGAGG